MEYVIVINIFIFIINLIKKIKTVFLYSFVVMIKLNWNCHLFFFVNNMEKIKMENNIYVILE